jgi:hypothetical protein
MVRCALIQADFHQAWKGDRSQQFLADIRMLREEFPSYIAITSHAIERLPPKKVGRLFSVIRCCAVMLSLFLLQSPTPQQISAYCANLWGYVVDRCPKALVRELHMVELAALLERIMDLQYGPRGSMGRRTMLSNLFPVNIDLITGKGAWFSSIMTRRITFAIVLAHRAQIRERMSYAQRFSVERGFRREEVDRNKALPFFEIGLTNSDVNMEEVELEPTGKPVPLADFCEPAAVVPKGEVCPICMGSVGVEEGDAVVTKCTHFFHQVCLNEWVNLSCMDASNACPTCRAEMCRVRERRLVDDAEVDPSEEEEGTPEETAEETVKETS